MENEQLEPNRPTDFRMLLQQELLRRCERNKSYSLRAFALSLEINHSTLSKILSGKRKLTERIIRTLGVRLLLLPEEIQHYVDLLSRNSARPSSGTKQSLQRYNLLLNDTFIVISDWFYDAILELTHLTDFEGDVQWISRVLGISVTETKIAIERLERLELLEITNEGKWIDTSRNNTNILDHSFTNAAMKKYQKKVLELSLNALETVPRELRDHTSMMVAIDTEDLLQIKERIREFRYELTAYLERPEAKANAIYQLGVSLFPLTSQISKRDTK